MAIQELNYTIQKIDKKTAKLMIVSNHYSKSFSPGTKSCFGLIDGQNNLIGVICYGNPHSQSLKESIAGKTYKNRILELNRLWIKDGTPKNTESWFISRTIPLLKGCDILVSFADPTQGHVGTIYQASNWLYTGKGQDSSTLVPSNHQGHPLSAIYGYRKKQLINIYGMENLKRVKIVGKHRYIYIVNSRKKKEIISRLRVTQQKYPKLGDI